jgi:Maltose operon periplasmic protein precursor (MalM)
MRLMILALMLALSFAAHAGKKERQQALEAIRTEVAGKLASATVCCEGNDYGDAIEIAGKEDLLLGFDRPLRQFDEGRSHFLLLRVPAAQKPFAMTVWEGATWVENFGFVWPNALLLDERFELVQKHVYDRGDGSFWKSKPYPSQTIDIDPSKHKYVVLYTDPELFGSETRVVWDVGIARPACCAWCSTRRRA